MIDIKETSFHYAGDERGGSVQNIDLTIHKGECVLLCGHSGCGKTTVTRLINGLVPNFFQGEFRGEVVVAEEDIFQKPMYQLAERVGSVFQNPRTQFFYMDTDGEIAFGCENEGMEKEELQKRLQLTLEQLKLQPLADRNLFELSGGEKQKIAFASVYAMNPDIYLLDEPSSNLDVESISELRNYLKLVKAQGKTIVVAEHRLFYLMDLLDRIVYLEDGRINRIMTREELQSLSDEERIRLGLRATELAKVHPCKDMCMQLKNEELVANIKDYDLLEVKNVKLFRKKRIILDGLTFRARKGEIIGITGMNGSGKTTFSRTLCGLHEEYTGEFFWNGESQKKKQLLKRSYMVMQDVNYQLFAESVAAECELGIKNPSKMQIEKILKDLDLWEYRDKHPNTLSGGQKQRVAVAVSMICNKDLLVFDEPTSGLDYDSMQKVAEMIKKLGKERIVFVVTHDYEFICQVCTRTIHFEQGKLVSDIPVDMLHEEVLRRQIGVKTLEQEE